MAEGSKFSYPPSSPLHPEFRFNESPYSYPVISAGSTSHLMISAPASNVSLNKDLPEPPAVLTPLRVSGAFANQQLPGAPKASYNASAQSLHFPVSGLSFTPQPGQEAMNIDEKDDRHSRRHISCTLVLPALVIVIIAAGLASLLLAYVLVLRGVNNFEREGLNALYGVAFYVTEGGTSQRQLGLMISTATTDIVALTCPILISVYAYCIAGLWLSSQRHTYRTHRREVSLPTPFQYGTLLTLFSAPTFKNILRTARYLRRGSRPHTPPFFSVAFWGVASVVFNSLLISFADVWLHATSTVICSEATSNLITRYPLAPLLTYTFLVYIYALLSLFICLFALTFRSPVVPSNDGSSPTALELIQVQLSDPLALVDSLWPLPRKSFAGRRIQDLFAESGSTSRLEVGLDHSTGTKGSADFRVHQRFVPWKSNVLAES